MTSITVSTVQNTIDVTEVTGTTVQLAVVEVTTAQLTTVGPQGPAGAPAFIYTQSSPSTTWTINHNLGYIPSVELFDTGSQEIEATVTHPSNSQAVILLTTASAGFARLI